MAKAQLPESFLMLTYEGLARVTIMSEQIQSMDAVLTKFSADKMMCVPKVAETPFGPVHISSWTGATPRTWVIQELARGTMMLSTFYQTVINEIDNEQWVSPIFTKPESAFPLRCLFDFEIWSQAGLRMFLGLNQGTRSTFLWVHYQGANQIYKPPFGNIFDNSCAICLGHNETQVREIFQTGQVLTTACTKTVELLAASTWNHDAFRSNDLPIVKQLVRFDAAKPDLPMLAPSDPSLITKCSIASNKELADITHRIINPYE